MTNDPNRLFRAGTTIVNEFFPGSYKWPDLYEIFRNGVEKTERHLVEAMRQLIETGDLRDMDKAAKALSLDGLAEIIFDECKDAFPLKTVLKRNPSHVKNFINKCVDIGREESAIQFKRAIDVVYYKDV